MYRRKPHLGRVIGGSVNKLSRAFSGVRENVVDVIKDTEVLSTSCGNESSEVEEILKETSEIPAMSVDNVDPRGNRISLRNLPTLLLSCGMNVDGVPSYILQLDQTVFLRNLNSHLYSSSRWKLLENMEEFMTNVKEYFADNDKFLRALSPTTTSADCHIARGSTQDCLIRLLLQIDEIQTELSNFLLDKLAELALQTEIDFESDITPITWVRLILQPFRYLNFIVNSKNLCERLFDIIFSSADKFIQQELIICLPDIIGDMEHYTAVIELSKLLKNELELMPSILDALTNLSVQREICEEVRRNLIGTLKSSPIEYLPNIVKFLLCTGESDSFDEILNGFRRELFANDSICFKNTINEGNVDVEGVKILIFNNIRNCLLASKQLTDAWTKNISNLNREMKCRPLDLMVTVLFYDICTEKTKKRGIETLFRSRIKNHYFHVQLIDEAFEYFTSPIIEFFNSFMSILSKLLKSVDPCVIDFITAFYLASFQNTNQQFSRTIIKELLAYVGAGDANDAQTALRILSAIVEKFRLKMLPLASMLRVLLNKFTDMPLKDVQLVMDVLCSLAFIEVEDDGDTMLLKAEVITSIETQVSSPNIEVSRVGIIGAVMAIKHITCVADEETNLSPNRCSEDFDEHVLSEKAKRGLPFLRLLIDGTRMIPESQGFAFDQFSLMLKKRKSMDKTFMYYVSLMMKENMKKYFLICNDEVKLIDFVECALKFGLNEDEEFVALNLTPTVVEERIHNSCAGLRMFVLVLPSLLRLIKELEYDDVREIDGLLECPAVVPAPSALDEFSIQSPEVQVVIMDSLFYLTNWFREIVNCFARLIKLPSGKKVLIRLRTIIWLQKLISKYLPQMLTKDYCPPKCHFLTYIRPPYIGSEKKKRKTLDEKNKSDSKTPDIRKHLVRTDYTQQSVLKDSDNEDSKDEMMANMKDYEQFFRELDWDVWVMLNLPLTLDPELEKDWQLKPEFGPSELLFVLEDLVEKLKFVLKSGTKKIPFKNSMNADVILTSIYSLYADVPELFVKNITKLTPRLCTHLESMAQFCQTLLKKNDNIFDATNMYTPLTVEIISAYSLILKAFFTLFNWSGFDEENNQDLFVAALLKINSRFESSVKSTSTMTLIKNCVNYFVQFQKTVLHLECGMNLIALIEVLNKRAEKCRDICKILGGTCWSFLSQHWYDWNSVQEKGAVFNKNIEYLLTTYFSCVSSKLRAIQEMCGWMLEVTNLNKGSSLTTLPNINKSNCNIVLRVILKALVTAAKESIDTQSKSTEQLELWTKVFYIMESIVAILKSQSVRTNLICFVRGSAPILRLFLNHGIAVCSSSFRNESLKVVQILKSSQITTRYLQKIFDNTKLTEDSALCAYLPSIRSLLESLLLRVKEIIVLNGCSEAFFVGSMRNKDIRGQDILSQSTVDQDSVRMDVDKDEINNDGGSIEIEDDQTYDDEENENASNVGDESGDAMENKDESDDESDNKRKRRRK